ncbi:MAG: spore photoproduct lyase family protein [Calditrichia bacterium]
MKTAKIPYKFSQIYIDQSVANDEVAEEIKSHFPAVPTRIVEADAAFQEKLARLSFSRGKQTLWITRYKGRFLKPCPGTSAAYLCCNYLVINEATNCPVDCSYCILQNYINNPAITIYSNYQDILKEVSTAAGLNPGRVLRMGTGELTDSLALDPIIGLSSRLIAHLNNMPNVILELKSKTDHIDHLLHLDPSRIVLAWSLNPPEFAEQEEHKSAAVSKRLAAAARAAEAGFLLAFHFDPILHLSGWKSAYSRLIEQLGQSAPPDRIAWISLGALRYPPGLKESARSRFPGSPVFSGEQIAGRDGKSRYLRPIRASMFRHIVYELKKNLGEVFLYFCMEDAAMWQQVLGIKPEGNWEVDFLFAQQLQQKFPELKLPLPQRESYRQAVQLTGVPPGFL